MTVYWRKSSFSQGSDHCVEVCDAGDSILVRDSKYLRNPANDPARQPIIAIPSPNWPKFLDLALGRPTVHPDGVPTLNRHLDGTITLRDTAGVTLVYTPEEWEAFTAGIAVGEFAA
ncbi:DUF397 domain-containing protein [Nocardia yamanashiensis]|uniref:DUF397 domain-containing protein n=1 Tax=Nocardia yamanashiensis TaxID=209247 RepID=UPI0008305D5B|nr:DUF397 domain-containing protein [Nocardia yamanashiensis]